MSVLSLHLNQTQTKQITKLLSNDTAKKIIDSLSKKSMTESELSETLKIPLSTIHDTISKLKKAGLVKSDEYKYSSKGRKVRYYKLVSDTIIIRTSPNLVGGFIALLVISIIHYIMLKTRYAKNYVLSAESTTKTITTTTPPEPNTTLYIIIGGLTVIAGLVIYNYLTYLILKYKK